MKKLETSGLDLDTTMNPDLAYWTADEIAECLDFGKYLKTYNLDWIPTYNKLWSFVNNASNPTPLGGDGSDGTVETPCGRLSLDNDDKPHAWWDKLTDAEKWAINKAICEI